MTRNYSPQYVTKKKSCTFPFSFSPSNPGSHSRVYPFSYPQVSRSQNAKDKLSRASEVEWNRRNKRDESCSFALPTDGPMICGSITDAVQSDQTRTTVIQVPSSIVRSSLLSIPGRTSCKTKKGKRKKKVTRGGIIRCFSSRRRRSPREDDVPANSRRSTRTKRRVAADVARLQSVKNGKT